MEEVEKNFELWVCLFTLLSKLFGGEHIGGRERECAPFPSPPPPISLQDCQPV